MSEKKYPFINREISWLSFNHRVLQEAKDKSVPLFERLKFLAIYSSNLDEFFRVRVANLRNLMRIGRQTKKELEFDPENLMQEILDIVHTQQDDFSEIFENEIIPELKKHDIYLLRRTELTEDQKQFVEDYFTDHLLPFVQPVLLVENKIKPFLNNASIYLALQLKEKSIVKKYPQRYAIVKIPSDYVERFVMLPSQIPGRKDLIILDDIVRESVRMIFPGYDIIDTYSIKLTRDAELYIEDEYSGDLISKIKRSLSKRNVGPASRLVYDREMPDELLQYLMKTFELSKYDLLAEGRYHNNSDFFKFPTFGMNHLKEHPLPAISIPDLEGPNSIFDAISEKDYMIHVPYHSYESVVKFFEDASVDPEVTHIKIVQYRVAKQSRIMNALMKASSLGKQVSAFIEVKARFDEEANLIWGEKLENNGVNVKYSMPGLKVHAKMALVRKFSNGKPTLFVFLSTGNFHEITAKIYSDIGIFTADERLTGECARLFTYLETKNLPIQPFSNMLVGQFNLKTTLIELVKFEINEARNGRPSGIILKMNSMQDAEMIDLLYEASQAGVKVDLIIRGICCIIPGIQGVSDKIHGIGILDRYLEHSRIFMFHHEGKKIMYLSSADWMVRNLHHRIETVFPVLDENIKEIISTIINIQLNDNIKARILDRDLKNEYNRNASDMATRSQLESYFYIKRITESALQQEDIGLFKTQE